MKNITTLPLRLFRWMVKANQFIEPRDYFERVYRYNCWEGELSRSGPGSEGEFANQKIEIIKNIIINHNISSILDLGCGDFHWMKEIMPIIDRYHGVDIVSELIKNNKKQFQNQHVSFQCLDICRSEEQKLISLTKVDLVLCLDVFGHLLNKEVGLLLELILNNINAKYLLVVNRRGSGSTDYTKQEKSRLEGIDIEEHPLFRVYSSSRLQQVPSLYPNDFYDLYNLKKLQENVLVSDPRSLRGDRMEFIID